MASGKQAQEIIRHIESFPELDPNPVLEIDFFGRINYCNSAALKTLKEIGLSGKDISEFIPKDLKRMIESLRNNKKPIFYEVKIGNKAFIGNICLSPEFKTLHVYLADITERKRTEDALRESEERYRNLVLTSPDAVLVHSGGKIKFVNPAGLKLFEATDKDKLIGKPILSIVPKEFHGIVKERIRLAQKKQTPLDEIKFVRLDGSIFDGDVTGRAIIYQGSPAIQVVIRDISERKRAEDDVNRFNRTLKALSETNQEFMRATDESEYLRKVCRIIVKDCGYDLVRISFFKNDKDKRLLLPVAQSGFGMRGLNKLDAVWDDTNFGCGPTERTIRTGKPCICRYTFTGANLRPWYKEAIKRGYRSLVVVPLTVNNKTFGLISIYSKKPDSFSQNEIKLLTDLADDLAYGITAIRFRFVHQQAREQLRESEIKFRLAFENSQDAILWADVKTGIIIDCNKAAEDLFEKIKTEIIGQHQTMLHPPQVREYCRKMFKKQAPGNAPIVELPIITKSGKIKTVMISASAVEIKGRKILQGIFRDVTGQKQAQEDLRKAHDELELKVAQRTAELTEANKHILYRNEILKLIGTKSSRKEFLKSVIELLKEWSGCQCLGIRVLDAEGRIPYDAYAGFSRRFWESENWLSIKEDQCACIRVIQGRAEPQDLPVMTKSGSFYTNNALKFENNLSKHAKTRFRGVCVRSGFKSLAVIPIRNRHETYGAIHFADPQEGIVPLEKVEFLESLTSLIGEGIHKFNLEDKIHKDHAILDAFFKHAVTPFVFLDPEFNFIRVNEAYAKACRREVSEFPGHNHFEFYPHEENEKIFREVVRTKVPFRAFARPFVFPKHPEWGVSYWDWELVPVLDNKGNVEFLVFSLSDVTERKLTEEKLSTAQKELETAKRLSDIGVLAATVAHELRNPLGVIRTAAYNIKRKAQNPLLDSHLNNIERKILESDQIINNLLFYSRLKTPQYETVRLYDILDECINSARIRFGGHKIRVIKKFGSLRKIVIDADPIQMAELFNNILNNAYDAFMGKNGIIEIMAKRDGKGSLEILFKDNGVGIEKEHLKNVFEPFFTTKAKGTGLGLTVCHQIANLHGGDIHVDSEKRKGTTVTVIIPVKRMLSAKENSSG